MSDEHRVTELVERLLEVMGESIPLTPETKKKAREAFTREIVQGIVRAREWTQKRMEENGDNTTRG